VSVLSMRSDKSELYDVIRALYTHGMTSPTLLGQAVQLSGARVIQILADMGLHKPRRSLRDHLDGLPEGLQRRLHLLNETRHATRKLKP
jgi:hypothetical protein